MAQKYFFNLVNVTAIIEDPSGVEADNIEQAEAEALFTLDEMRVAGELQLDKPEWRLEICDESGRVLRTIRLTSEQGERSSDH
ncbi:hypothetical protein OPKNFCMD_2787 [Methylobacterium crusticola]|uniref:DUF6894 domain-containing protein n=1 Tax=Methylobacterium crusticola TaxID=1697972 RepID=A0ABQ4QYB6_9HYPH|nr:hypothetical protein [Methylobacterium crusticola]GJD50051.1 hypothetical protein OPKNFCMD_2787 [Methylobacterium crusticola]